MHLPTGLRGPPLWCYCLRCVVRPIAKTGSTICSRAIARACAKLKTLAVLVHVQRAKREGRKRQSQSLVILIARFLVHLELETAFVIIGEATTRKSADATDATAATAATAL